jgi:hypothetical protein
MTPDPRAFVKNITFETVIHAFRKSTGVTVQGGNVATLPQGQRSVDFKLESNDTPFKATGTSGLIRLERGFVSYAGRTYYFPSAIYSGSSPGGVFLKLDSSYTAFEDVTDEPWSVMPNDYAPLLVWRSMTGLGEYSLIRNPKDDDYTTDDYEITLSGTATLYIPIAGWSGSRVINFINRNLFLMPQNTGAIDYTLGWG